MSNRSPEVITLLSSDEESTCNQVGLSSDMKSNIKSKKITARKSMNSYVSPSHPSVNKLTPVFERSNITDKISSKNTSHTKSLNTSAVKATSSSKIGVPGTKCKNYGDNTLKNNNHVSCVKPNSIPVTQSGVKQSLIRKASVHEVLSNKNTKNVRMQRTARKSLYLPADIEIISEEIKHNTSSKRSSSKDDKWIISKDDFTAFDIQSKFKNSSITVFPQPLKNNLVQQKVKQNPVKPISGSKEVNDVTASIPSISIGQLKITPFVAKSSQISKEPHSQVSVLQPETKDSLGFSRKARKSFSVSKTKVLESVLDSLVQKGLSVRSLNEGKIENVDSSSDKNNVNGKPKNLHLLDSSGSRTSEQITHKSNSSFNSINNSDLKCKKESKSNMSSKIMKNPSFNENKSEVDCAVHVNSQIVPVSSDFNTGIHSKASVAEISITEIPNSTQYSPCKIKIKENSSDGSNRSKNMKFDSVGRKRLLDDTSKINNTVLKSVLVSVPNPGAKININEKKKKLPTGRNKNASLCPKSSHEEILSETFTNNFTPNISLTPVHTDGDLQHLLVNDNINNHKKRISNLKEGLNSLRVNRLSAEENMDIVSNTLLGIATESINSNTCSLLCVKKMSADISEKEMSQINIEQKKSVENTLNPVQFFENASMENEQTINQRPPHKQVTSPKLSLKRKAMNSFDECDIPEKKPKSDFVKKLDVSSPKTPDGRQVSKENEVSDVKEPWKSTHDNPTKLQKLLDFCVPILKATKNYTAGEESKISRRILKYCNLAQPSYVKSWRFEDLLLSSFQKIKSEPQNIYVHLNEIRIQLQSQKLDLKEKPVSLDSSTVNTRTIISTDIVQATESKKSSHINSPNVSSEPLNVNIISERNFDEDSKKCNISGSKNNFRTSLVEVLGSTTTSVSDTVKGNSEFHIHAGISGKSGFTVSGLEADASNSMLIAPSTLKKMSQSNSGSVNSMLGASEHEGKISRTDLSANISVPTSETNTERKYDKTVSETNECKISSVSAGPSNLETYDAKVKKHIKNLERHLGKLQRKINKLRTKEFSVDDLDKAESAYILEDRYQRKALKVWETLCKLTKSSTRTGRDIDKHFIYEGSRYEAINKAISKFINKKKPKERFPNYVEILNVIKKLNEVEDLGLTNMQVERTASEVFNDIGLELKERRIHDYKRDFGCHLTDTIDFDNDPAERDEILSSKLCDSVTAGERKIAEIIDKFASVQYEGMDEEEGYKCESTEGDDEISEGHEDICEFDKPDHKGEEGLSKDREHNNMNLKEEKEAVKISDVVEETNDLDTDPAVHNSGDETDDNKATVNSVTGNRFVINIDSNSDASTEPEASTSEPKKLISANLSTLPPGQNDEIEIVDDNVDEIVSSPDLPSLSEILQNSLASVLKN